jgi:1,4-alpha-glucan branching enzyme
MLKKKFLKSKNVVQVTFEVKETELPENIDVKQIHLVGDFNDWEKTATSLDYVKSARAYKTRVKLEPGQEFQFRYLINGANWHNDWQADGYVSNQVDGDNCLVNTNI